MAPQSAADRLESMHNRAENHPALYDDPAFMQRLQRTSHEASAELRAEAAEQLAAYRRRLAAYQD